MQRSKGGSGAQTSYIPFMENMQVATYGSIHGVCTAVKYSSKVSDFATPICITKKT